MDTMGGDYAPEEIIKGAAMAAQNRDAAIILVGSIEILKEELTKYNR